MKKKIILTLILSVAALCIFTLAVSAEVTTYTDAPARTNIQVSTNDVVVFDDGFSCPTAYVFKDISSIPNGKWGTPSLPGCFDFEYINQKTGGDYKFENIVSLDLPQGITSIGTYLAHKITTIKRVSIPDSVTTIASSTFEACTSIEECVFEHNEGSAFKSFPQYMFSGAESLKAFSMPDCVTELNGEGSHFANCKSLTALYLSKNLTSIPGTRGDRPSFDYCDKLYLVGEPFGYDSIPEKPTVYYFPANLENFPAKHCSFRGCNSLNDVLVFGTKITSMPNMYFLQNAPTKTVIFLGDMADVSVSYWGSVANVIFANSNDKDAGSVNLAVYTGNWGHACYYNFCATGNRYAANKGSVDEIVASLEEGAAIHVVEKALATEATCINPKMVADYCYCGAIVGTPQTEGEALGHDLSFASGAIDLGVAYLDYFNKGAHKIDCARCDTVDEVEVDALFVDKGYSACTFSTGYSITRGYAINKTAIEAYKAYAPDFEIGVVIAVNQGKEAFVPDFESEKVINAKFNATANDYIDVKVTGIPADKAEALIVLSAYVIDGGKTYFLENGVTSESVVGIDYASAPKK